MTSERRTKFHGVCIDTGAQASVVGEKQAKAYCREVGITFKTSPSRSEFKFGDGTFKSKGKIKVRIPTPDGSFIEIDIDVVEADVPMLLGIDVMDRERIVANNVTNYAVQEDGRWKMPLIRKFGHMYLVWKPNEILFTRPELVKLHRHFRHPTEGKLWELIKRARPHQADEKTHKLLSEITKSCKTCQTFSAPPQRFTVSLPPSEIYFNRQVALDLMWIERRAVLHVVDTETHFNAAVFLKKQTVEGVWDAFVSCWAAIYIGFPEKLRVDQGSAFTSVRWTRLCDMVGTEIQLSGVEAHNALGSGERYHAPLRRIFRKIRNEEPKLDMSIVLQLAVKAINDTMGPEGLVPSLLVFGCIPRFPAVSSKVPEQKERMNALISARQEMATITAELRVTKALRSKVPRNADLVIFPGQRVLVWRESDKKYIGPYPVIRVDDKQVYLLDGNVEKQFSVHQVIPEKQFNSIINGDDFIESLHTGVIQFKSTKEERKSEDENQKEVHIIEVLHPKDLRFKNKEADDARKKELDNLIRRGTWKIVLEKNVPKGANIISGMFVMTIKDVETDSPIYKARYVAHGHRDNEKNELVHNSTTARQSSTRLMLAIAATLEFKVWSQDISQAYLQGAEKLSRDVYIRPGPELKIPSGHLLKLLKPIYGLADSGDIWNTTFSKHLQEDLGMQRAQTDMSMFFKRDRKELTGIEATYVDDSLAVGDESFNILTNETGKRFEAKEKEFNSLRFSGVYIETSEKGFRIHQKSYIERLTELKKDANFTLLRRSRAQLTWLIHTRPDICVDANRLAQGTEELFSIEHVKKYNKIVRYLHATKDRSLEMNKLDRKSIHIRAYSDASFATNYDLSSQLGYIVMLADEYNNADILHYVSHKSRRVTRSVLGAETYAFADAFDFAYCAKKDLETMLGCHIPLQMYTDSKSLFDILTKCSNTTERRLMIDLQSVRNAYENHEISNIGFLRGPNNPADGLTKESKSGALEYFLKSGKADFEVENYVIRKNISQN